MQTYLELKAQVVRKYASQKNIECFWLRDCLLGEIEQQPPDFLVDSGMLKPGSEFNCE